MVPEGWEKARFEEVTRIANGQVDPKVEPYSSMLHIGPENVTSHSGQLSGCKTGKELGLISGKYEFDEQAIVYSKIRPNLNKVCRPKFHGLCSADMYPIWAKEGLDIDYLYHYMLSPGFFETAIAMSMRTGMPKINRSDLNAVRIVLPPLPEQKKIAQILSTWDQAISATERLLENSQQRKKGLMQQLLTGKKRLPGFEGEWENSILTEHCSVTTGNKDLQNKVENGEYPFFVRSSNIERIDSYSFDGEAILIPGDGRVGEIFHYIDGKFDFHQRVYKLSDFEGALGLFIYYYLKRFFKAEVIKNSVKATVDSLRMPVFTGMRIKLPSLEEQRQIVDVLSCSDKEIQAITQRLYLLKQEKKALMQQLLTGKRRVKVEADAA